MVHGTGGILIRSSGGPRSDVGSAPDKVKEPGEVAPSLLWGRDQGLVLGGLCPFSQRRINNTTSFLPSSPRKAVWVGELRLRQAGLSTILLPAVWPRATPSPSLGPSSSSEVKVHTWRLENGEEQQDGG